MIRWMTLFFFISIINTSIFVKNIFVYSNLREPRIIGGRNAILGQFPYVVSIQHNGTRNTCGGGIIDDRFILTAAHCILSPETKKLYEGTMKVVLNSVNLKKDRGLRIDVEKAYVLRKFTKSIQNHDIGILKLKKSLDLANSQVLKKLDLPKSPETKEYVGKTGIVTGFGYNSINTYFTAQWILKESGGHSNHGLRYAKVNIISNEACKLLGYLTGGVKLTINQICGHMYQHSPFIYPEGACTGDSGSSLVIGNTVVGVLSASPVGCNEVVNAAKYTRVSQYLNFIQDVLKGQLNDKILEFDIQQPQESTE